jgi:hypothetical protein
MAQLAASSMTQMLFLGSANKMKKIPKQYKMVIFAFLMSFNTALIVSGVITFINTPSIKIFLDKWPSNFILGWPLVFLSIILVGPPVNKLVSLLVTDTP